MVQATADRVRFSYVKEVSYGVFPSASITDVRMTNESFRQVSDSVQSAELRSDSQAGDVVRQFFNAEGDLNFELSYTSFEDFMEATLRSAVWSTPVTDVAADTAIQVLTGADRYRGVATEFANYSLPGQWVKASGFTNAANNGLRKVVSVTTDLAADDTLTVEGGLAMIVEAAGASVSITLVAMIKNATTTSSWAFERQYTDLTTTYAQYIGMMFNTLALSVVAGQIITGTFGLLGKNEKSSATSGGSGYTVAPTTKVMNAVNDVVAILEKDAVHVSTEFSFNLNGSLRLRQEIAQNAGPTSEFGQGTFEITGTLKAFFQASSEQVIDKYLNDTATSLSITCQDAVGNGYVFDFPAVKYTSGQRIAGGVNTDVLMELEFRVEREATEDVMIRISRYT